jgi:hypothetical protein
MKRKRNPDLSDTLNDWLEEQDKSFEDRVLDKLSDITNRSMAQTRFLYDLLGKDLEKLLLLEEKSKSNTLSYCPGDLESAEKILKMNHDPAYFNLDEFRGTYTGKFYSHFAMSVVSFRKDKFYDPKTVAFKQREVHYAVPGYFKVLPGTLPLDLKVEKQEPPKTLPAFFKVLSSDRKTQHTVSLQGGKFSCDCVGFGFHRKCSHIEELYNKYTDGHWNEK